MSNREQMEASERRGHTAAGERRDRPYIESIWIASSRIVREGAQTPGFNRWQLMVETILPRLTEAAGRSGLTAARARR